MKWLVLFPLLVVLLEAKNQTVKVKGEVLCNKIRQAGVIVELWEHDSLDPDDWIATGETDAFGRFHLIGSITEFSTITPYLVFKHKCNVENENCLRHTEYDVPKKFINSEDWYDMTFICMDIYNKNEKEKCYTKE